MNDNNCRQGRDCPAGRRTIFFAALLALTACGEATTKWEYDNEIFLGAGDGGYSAPDAGHSDPAGVVGVDSDAASDDADAGDDDSGSHGDVGKGHDGKGHDGKGHDHGDGDDD